MQPGRPGGALSISSRGSVSHSLQQDQKKKKTSSQLIPASQAPLPLSLVCKAKKEGWNSAAEGGHGQGEGELFSLRRRPDPNQLLGGGSSLAVRGDDDENVGG